MKTLLKRLVKEWEKLLFWLTMTFVGVMLVMWVGGFGEDGGNVVSKKSAPSQRSLLTGTALAFLDRIAPPDNEEINPFAFTFLAPKKKRPWQVTSRRTTITPAPRTFTSTVKRRWRPPVRKTTEQPPSVTGTKTVTPTNVRPPVPKTAATSTPPKWATWTPKPKADPNATGSKTDRPPRPPDKPPVRRVVTFQGMIKSMTGKEVALVEVVDPDTNATSTRYLAAGREVDGIQVQNVTPDAMRIVDAHGREREIAFKKSEDLIIE